MIISSICCIRIRVHIDFCCVVSILCPVFCDSYALSNWRVKWRMISYSRGDWFSLSYFII